MCEARREWEDPALVKAEMKQKEGKRKTRVEKREGEKEKEKRKEKGKRGEEGATSSISFGAIFNFQKSNFSPLSFLNFHFPKISNFYHTLVLLKISFLALIFQKVSS